MMRSYLLKINGKVAERPQHMLMRVALGIHQTDIEAAIETYKLLSEKWFTHASPTLFNAGTCKPQLSSCFLVTMTDDSIDGIYDTLTLCAKISKAAGGIGINVHNIRASGSYIAGVRNHPEDGKHIIAVIRGVLWTAVYAFCPAVHAFIQGELLGTILAWPVSFYHQILKSRPSTALDSHCDANNVWICFKT